MRGELETEQNCNILTSTLIAITAFLSRSPGQLNREPGGPVSLGHVPHSGIFSPTGLNFLSPWLYNNLTSTLLPVSVTISHSIQPLDSQGYILIFLDRMHLLFTQVHFLFWQLGRVGGQYATILERSPQEANGQISRHAIVGNLFKLLSLLEDKRGKKKSNFGKSWTFFDVTFIKLFKKFLIHKMMKKRNCFCFYFVRFFVFCFILSLGVCVCVCVCVYKCIHI